MMAIASEAPAANWRNIAAWAAAGAVFYVLMTALGTVFVNGKGLGDLVGGITGSGRIAGMLGLGLVLSMAVFGFAYRKRALNPRTALFFVINNAVAIGAFLVVVRAFTALSRSAEMTPSIWAAAVAGATVIVIAALGSVAVGIAHGRADLIEDQVAAEEMRERTRLLLYSFAWMIAWGLMLVLLAVAQPTALLSPQGALTATLALVAVLAGLTVAVWRLMDELDRTVSFESGNMAYYLILLIGGGWAALAHLGFATGPAPLDWLTLFTGVMFAASFIVLGRRKLLTR